MTVTISRLCNSYPMLRRQLNVWNLPEWTMATSAFSRAIQMAGTRTTSPRRRAHSLIAIWMEGRSRGGCRHGRRSRSRSGRRSGRSDWAGYNGNPRCGTHCCRWLARFHIDGAAAGGATGGVLGALTQAGVGKDEADIYAESLRRGGALVSGRVADADVPRLQAVLESWRSRWRIAVPSIESPVGRHLTRQLRLRR